MRYLRFGLCLLLALLQGCMAVRYQATLPETRHDVTALAGQKFRIAEVDIAGLAKRADIHEQIKAFSPARLGPSLAEAYPGLFTEEAGALPLRVVVTGEEDDNSPWGPMLTGFTMGVIPFPDKNWVKATVRVEVAVDGLPPLQSPVQTSFETRRVMYMSLVGPLGLVGLAGPSDAPRGAMFLFIPLTRGVYNTVSPAEDLALRSLREAVMRALPALDRQAMATAMARRARMSREVDLGGRRVWLQTRITRAEAGAPETAVVDVVDGSPGPGGRVLASLPVALHKGSGWEMQRALLPLGDRDYAVMALLEDGVPVQPVAQLAEPALEELLRTPVNAEGLRWASTRLLAFKNARWPQQVQAMTPEQVSEYLTRLETTILDDNAAQARANDSAQQAIAAGNDPAAWRERAILLRQRIEILKALLQVLHQR